MKPTKMFILCMNYFVLYNTSLSNCTIFLGDKGNTIFGEVSRPQNPQFMNVPDIDKSVDNESFRIDWGIVKIENQKKPEIISNSSAVDEQMQPKWKILQRTPNKMNIPTSIVIPDNTLVENIQVLNSLAELYSGFLDNNLVFNPMTELYFIVNLITNQYKDNLKQKSSIKNNVEEKSQDCKNGYIKDCKYDTKELSALKKSLNFDDLIETEDLEHNAKVNHDNNLQCDRSSVSELGCSSLIDDPKENLNVINSMLKRIDVNVDETTRNEAEIHKECQSIENVNVTKDCLKLYLDTPHNCVYFSSQVLNFQKEFLKCLDRVTLKLLCENNQMCLFQAELCKYLDSIYNMKVSESNKTKSSLNIG